jgi:hypothetical protein
MKNTDSLLYLLSAPTNSMSPKPSSTGVSNDLLIRSGRLVWALPYHGAGTSEPPPADHGVRPSHPMDDQFWELFGFPAILANGHDFGTVYVNMYTRIQ